MTEDATRSVQFHYNKSNAFRVVHGDGVWGGVTPRGGISMSFFSERGPIPKSLRYALSADGNLGEIEESDSKGGIVREVEVTVMIDLDVARSLVSWLEDHIKKAETAKGRE